MKLLPKQQPELVGFRCVCGLEYMVDLRRGPATFTAECPDLECRRLFIVEYVGRVPAPAMPEVEPMVLRVV